MAQRGRNRAKMTAASPFRRWETVGRMECTQKRAKHNRICIIIISIYAKWSSSHNTFCQWSNMAATTMFPNLMLRISLPIMARSVLLLLLLLLFDLSRVGPKHTDTFWTLIMLTSLLAVTYVTVILEVILNFEYSCIIRVFVSG